MSCKRVTHEKLKTVHSTSAASTHRSSYSGTCLHPGLRRVLQQTWSITPTNKQDWVTIGRKCYENTLYDTNPHQNMLPLNLL